MLNRDEQERLLRLARLSLEAKVFGLTLSDPEEDEVAVAAGAFVSVHRGRELRGCLGRLEPVPLARAVVQLARAVADSDPRFPPISAEELPAIDIEISVLTPEREIASPADIDVGRHGLIVEQGVRRGLLLPQVAAEHGWDRLTFLEHTCLKAGLPRDAWRHGARVLVFEAQVFGDETGSAVDASPTGTDRQ